MSMISAIAELVGIGGGTAVSTSLNGLGDAAIKIRSAITGQLPPEKAAEVEQHLADLEAQAEQGQMLIDQAEAQSGSKFVAGWRPAIGWVCALSLFLYYIPRLILGMYFWSLQVYVSGNLMQMPEMGISDILGLTATLLGSAGLRTIEKKLGVQGNH